MDSTACLLAVLLSVLPAGEAPRKPEEKRPPEAVNDTGPWKLPPEGYRQALRAVARESGSAGSVTVEVSAAPDAYLYQMAEGMEEIRKAGYSDRELKGKLRSLHERLKSQKGKVLFFVQVSASGDDYRSSSVGRRGLATPMDKTTTVTAASRLPSSMIDKPSPKFDRWQVFEMRPDEPRRIYHRSLARFERLEFSLSATPGKKDDREPIRVAVKGFLRVGGAKSRKKDLDGSQVHQGINLAQRQITMPRWEDQAVPEVVLTFHPGQWKLPTPPPGFEELLRRLDEKR